VPENLPEGTRAAKASKKTAQKTVEQEKTDEKNFHSQFPRISERLSRPKNPQAASRDSDTTRCHQSAHRGRSKSHEKLCNIKKAEKSIFFLLCVQKKPERAKDER
jgi:hypothetical protein